MSDGAFRKCHECGKVFDQAKRKLRTLPDYNLTADGPICRNRPECRGRQLSAMYDERGLKRWARETQEELLAIMDVPPPSWDRSRKWESIHLPHDRVLAAIKFFSICWPVCLLYAVQTDADGEPIREYSEWKRHTHRSLAQILALDQSRVTRSIAYLRDRRLVDEEDGRLSPGVAPKSLNSNERDACTRISDADLKDLAALPVKALKMMEAIRAIASPDDYTRIKGVAADACIELNTAISDARARASQKVFDACQPHVSLLSRLGRTGESAKPSSSSDPVVKPERSRPEMDDDVEHAPIDELYAAGMGKGALAKLPSPRPAIQPAMEIAIALGIDTDAASQLYSGILAHDGTVTAGEAIELAAMKIQQVKEALRKGKVTNLPGLLIRSVPKMVKGPDLAMARASAKRTVERREQDQAEKRAWAERVLASPESGETERQWARDQLGIQTTGASGDD